MYQLIYLILLASNNIHYVLSTLSKCKALNLSNIQCEIECSYYNDINLYYNFIMNDYNNITAMILDTNISTDNVNETLLNQTLRWYSLSTYPHEYYPNIQPDLCSYSLGTYCNMQINGPSDIMHGCCIPSHCKNDDAIKVLKANIPCFQSYNKSLQGIINDNHMICKIKEREFNIGFTVFVMVIILLLLFIIICTIIKYNKCGDNSIFIQSFCIQNNWKAFMKTRDPKNSKFAFCDGFRVISAYWIVSYHLSYYIDSNTINRPTTAGRRGSFFFQYLYPPYLTSDNIYTNNWSHFVPSTLWFTVSINLVAMVTFFWLSGFFGAYSMINALEKWKQNRYSNKYGYIWQILCLYLKRYLRLIPIVLFLFYYNTYIFDQIPNSYSVTSRNDRHNECEKASWSVIFLYNNIYRLIKIHYLEQDDPSECINGLWYICADMQLHLLLPFICFIFVYVDSKKIYGLISCSALIIISLCIRLYFGTYYHFFENPYDWNVETLNDGNCGLQSYSMPYAWMMHYYFGVLTKILFIYLKPFNNNIKIRRDIHWFLQSLAIILIISYIVMPYSNYYDWPNNKWNWQTTSIYYYPFGALIYCVGLSLFVFLCVNNNCYSIIKSFLSCKLFQIISKLSFCIYLVHVNGVLQIWQLNSQYPQYFSFINFVILQIAFCFFATILAFILWIFIENPMNTLITKLWKKCTSKLFETKSKQNNNDNTMLLYGDTELDEFVHDNNNGTYGAVSNPNESPHSHYKRDFEIILDNNNSHYH